MAGSEAESNGTGHGYQGSCGDYDRRLTSLPVF
jgi:hypothetical protein